MKYLLIALFFIGCKTTDPTQVTPYLMKLEKVELKARYPYTGTNILVWSNGRGLEVSTEQSTDVPYRIGQTQIMFLNK